MNEIDLTVWKLLADHWRKPLLPDDSKYVKVEEQKVSVSKVLSNDDVQDDEDEIMESFLSQIRQ